MSKASAAAVAARSVAPLTMEQLSEIIVTHFVNGGLKFAGGVQLNNAMTLHRQLQMGNKEFLLLAAHLSDILHENFPEVENGALQTISDLKQVIIDTLVRQRDTHDLKRPCANCKALVPKPSRCGRCKNEIYCSMECQHEHWKQHKKKCTAPDAQTDMGTLSLRKPAPPAPEHGLRFQYASSVHDGIDCNLLIVLHGNGDNEANFGRYCGNFTLVLTSVLAVRAPHAMGMSGMMWYQEIDETVRLPKGDRTRIRPCVEAAELLVQLFRAAERQWPPHRIFVLGHGQGGVVAVEAAMRYEKYLGCVVAAGDCLLDEVARDFVAPTAIEKKQCDLRVGDSMKFFDVEVLLESARSSKPEDEQCKQWQYTLVVAKPAQPDVKHTYTVVCEHTDFGNARARGRLINAFAGEYRMRVSGYERDGITLSIETTFEAEQDMAKKSATRVFYTRGGKDTLAKPAMAPAKIDYLNRHFRFVEERMYPKRKDVLGSDPDEFADIRAFFIKCQVHQALKYVPPVVGRIKN